MLKTQEGLWFELLLKIKSCSLEDGETGEGDACLKETISMARVGIQHVMKVMQGSDNRNNKKLWL